MVYGQICLDSKYGAIFCRHSQLWYFQKVTDVIQRNQALEFHVDVDCGREPARRERIRLYCLLLSWVFFLFGL